MNVGYFSKLDDNSIIFILPDDLHKTISKKDAVKMVEGFKLMMKMTDAKKLVNQSYPFEGAEYD